MKSENDPFVTFLERLREVDDRAALAKLRRGLGKRMGTPDMYPYVVPFLPDNRLGQERLFLIASLFAMHPEPAARGRNMGAVFRLIQGATGSESIQKRFVNILDSDMDYLGKRLQQAISLAKSKGVAVDYHRLLNDLRFWDHRDRFVQLQWAKDFWGYVKQSFAGTTEGEN
jgi:CRISPR system Cascade subunit CasB